MTLNEFPLPLHSSADSTCRLHFETHFEKDESVTHYLRCGSISLPVTEDPLTGNYDYIITTEQKPFCLFVLGSANGVAAFQSMKLPNPTMHLSHVPQYITLQQKCAHFRYKVMYWGICYRYIMGFVILCYWNRPPLPSVYATKHIVPHTIPEHISQSGVS